MSDSRFDQVDPPWDNFDKARSLFPHGLTQPAGSYRFSCDALLLADFASKLALPPHAAVADLGTGCGVVGLDMIRLRPDIPDLRVVGVERGADLAAAACDNARRLGATRFSVVVGDVDAPETLHMARRALAEKISGVKQEGPPLFDLVVCNPPWRLEGAGRVPPSPARRAALFGNRDTLPLFFTAADRLLKTRGALALVCGADRLEDALTALPPRLHPVRLRFVHTKQKAAAIFFLLEAQKGAGAKLVIEAPLLLYAENQAANAQADTG